MAPKALHGIHIVSRHMIYDVIMNTSRDHRNQNLYLFHRLLKHESRGESCLIGVRIQERSCREKNKITTKLAGQKRVPQYEQTRD